MRSTSARPRFSLLVDWRLLVGLCAVVGFGTSVVQAETSAGPPPSVTQWLADHCWSCHSGPAAEAGLDLESLAFDLNDRQTFDRWLLIHDRVAAGEMPPPDDGVFAPVAAVGWSEQAAVRQLAGEPVTDREASEADIRALVDLAAALIANESARVRQAGGRAAVRRLNRYEYENLLRGVLSAPWLQVSDQLPEDGVAHLFNKVSTHLDTSHVQVMRWLAAADNALRQAVDAAAHPPQTRRMYARTEPTIRNYLSYRFGQMAATRSVVPLLDLQPELEIIRSKQPLTVGKKDPATRERESMGAFSGTYSATTKYDFMSSTVPTAGDYRVRFKTFAFRAGPNGANGGTDHGLTGGKRAWWQPDRTVILPGERSEPVTLYALARSGDNRWLTTFDSHPKPSVFETVVTLRGGEGFRPDATRLVRTRPGWQGNPNATPEGVPGFAMHWLEWEGPLHDQWPPASYQAVFGELPFEVDAQKRVRVISRDPAADARRLIADFYRRATAHQPAGERDDSPYQQIYQQATEAGLDFTDSVLMTLTSILCSPEVMYWGSGDTSDGAAGLRQRLACFLWNGPDPDTPQLDDAGGSPAALREAVEHLLSDPRRERFVNAFLDYWLDLRDLNVNSPDAELYPDYYLDDWLTESSLLETRLFFNELIDRDLPARNLVDSDFTYVNERLAQHYGLPETAGVGLQRVTLPAESPYGGLLTQASVMRVTANGTTTSPVVRGAWVSERIIGVPIPSPPSGLDAVEPDTRGTTTIREQLDKHRSVESCNACHVKFDHLGFALESFDVAGAWREQYRAVGDKKKALPGFGKNGHAYKFFLAQAVQCEGVLPTGDTFQDIRELKRLLVVDDRQIARNLLHQFIVFSTGAAVGISDRAAVETILDRAAKRDYGVRTLIHELVQSPLFLQK